MCLTSSQEEVLPARKVRCGHWRLVRRGIGADRPLPRAQKQRARAQENGVRVFRSLVTPKWSLGDSTPNGRSDRRATPPQWRRRRGTDTPSRHGYGFQWASVGDSGQVRATLKPADSHAKVGVHSQSVEWMSGFVRSFDARALVRTLLSNPPPEPSKVCKYMLQVRNNV